MDHNMDIAVDVSIVEIKDEIIEEPEPFPDAFEEHINEIMDLQFTDSNILFLKSYNYAPELNNSPEKSKIVQKKENFDHDEMKDSQLILERVLCKEKTICETDSKAQKEQPKHEQSKKTVQIDKETSIIISHMNFLNYSRITKTEGVIKTNEIVKRKLNFEDENVVPKFKNILDNQVLRSDNEKCSNSIEKRSYEPKNNVKPKIDKNPNLTPKQKQVMDTGNEKSSNLKQVNKQPKLKYENVIPKMNKHGKLVKNGMRDVEPDNEEHRNATTAKIIPKTHKNLETVPKNNDKVNKKNKEKSRDSKSNTKENAVMVSKDQELKKLVQNLTAFKIIDFNHQPSVNQNHKNNKNGENIYDDIKLQSKTTVELYDWSNILKYSPRYCSICQTFFATSEKLNKHIQNWHDKFYCKYCQITLSNRTRLEKHLEIHRAAEELVTKYSRRGPKIKSCYICRKRFESQRALRVHVRSHKVTLTCKCENELIETNSKNLNMKNRSHTEIKVYKNNKRGIL